LGLGFREQNVGRPSEASPACPSPDNGGLVKGQDQDQDQDQKQFYHEVHEGHEG